MTSVTKTTEESIVIDQPDSTSIYTGGVPIDLDQLAGHVIIDVGTTISDTGHLMLGRINNAPLDLGVLPGWPLVVMSASLDSGYLTGSNPWVLTLKVHKTTGSNSETISLTVGANTYQSTAVADGISTVTFDLDIPVDLSQCLLTQMPNGAMVPSAFPLSAVTSVTQVSTDAVVPYTPVVAVTGVTRVDSGTISITGVHEVMGSQASWPANLDVTIDDSPNPLTFYISADGVFTGTVSYPSTPGEHTLTVTSFEFSFEPTSQTFTFTDS